MISGGGWGENNFVWCLTVHCTEPLQGIGAKSSVLHTPSLDPLLDNSGISILEVEMFCAKYFSLVGFSYFVVACVQCVDLSFVISFVKSLIDSDDLVLNQDPCARSPAGRPVLCVRSRPKSSGLPGDVRSNR